MSQQSKLDWLFAPLQEQETYNKLLSSVDKSGVFAVTGLDDTARLHMLAALSRATGRMLLFVTATEHGAQKAADDLSAMLEGRVKLFPSREVSFLKVAAASRELAARRIEALGAALSGGLKAIAAPVDSLLFSLMPADTFKKSIILLQRGMVIDPAKLSEMLTNAGYEACDAVENRGQWSKRGGIIDVFPIGRSSALRLEFFDDELDSIREFDTMTQRSTDTVERAAILPAHEAILTKEQAEQAADRILADVNKECGAAPKNGMSQQEIEKKFDLEPWTKFMESFDDELPSLDDMEQAMPESVPAAYVPQTELEKQFLPRIEQIRTSRLCPAMDALMPYLYDETGSIIDYLKNPIIVLDQPDRLRTRCEGIRDEFNEQHKIAVSRNCALKKQAQILTDYDTLLTKLTSGTSIAVMPVASSQNDLKLKGLFHFDALNGSSIQSNMKELVSQLKIWKKEGWRVALLTSSMARGRRLYQILDEMGVSVPLAESVARLTPGMPLITVANLERGFRYPNQKLCIVTDGDIFGTQRQKSRSSWHAGEKISAFTDLAVGDYVVHESYGIGQYMGMERRLVAGCFGDYLIIRYNGTDKLLVPTHQLDQVQKYIGGDNDKPRLSSLSGTGGDWQRQKAKVKSAIDEIAKDLVELYAARHDAVGYAFSPDTPWQQEFEDKFPYDETDDQLTAIAEIKHDMEQQRPMDRLLCGDVGYGKTEVALRAIFKCVMDGKQAVLLAPTTILVQQHYQTLIKRFDGYPVNIDMLSRFRTTAQQKATIEKMAEGKVDIVVGTHKLLSKNVSFKNLGLLVVDEEQRFGVKHKEAIKQMKNNVDVLTLSATPIPRTLHMSMTGIRDMSLLRTPPEERYPVQNYVVEYSDSIVRDAILRELNREGQVYVLYNRVQSIERFYERLRKLVPEARIGIGHGQMKESVLEDVMMDFYEGNYDVLLCTTIIEAGLDVPRANTMIIMDADRFGLAQLYQLRGRVGRSNRLAYAYLCIAPNKVLTETANKRLDAIREFTEFGAGFRVAMRDLEIRGTGNILGNAQSGHMADVGYDLYVKMIEDAIAGLRGEKRRQEVNTRMEVRVDAYLPTEYVPTDKLRIDVYKRIATVNGTDTRREITDELIDRFGDIPKPVSALLDVAQLKGVCARLSIESVSVKQGRLLMQFGKNVTFDVDKFLKLVAKYRNLRIEPSEKPVLIYDIGAVSHAEYVKKAIPIMEALADALAPL